MNQPPTSGRPDCPRCRGAGIEVKSGSGEFAHAEVCGCVPVCPVCDGSGRIDLLQDGHPAVARCRCRILFDRAALFERAQIPARHAKSTLESFDHRTIEGAGKGFTKVWAWLEQMVAGNGPIRRLCVVDVRQSMANGGGPACLRLRVVADPAAVDPRFLVDAAKLDRIAAGIAERWPEQIAPGDLLDPALWDRIEAARRALCDALDLAELD